MINYLDRIATPSISLEGQEDWVRNVRFSIYLKLKR